MKWAFTLRVGAVHAAHALSTVLGVGQHGGLGAGGREQGGGTAIGLWRRHGGGHWRS